MLGQTHPQTDPLGQSFSLTDVLRLTASRTDARDGLRVTLSQTQQLQCLKGIGRVQSVAQATLLAVGSASNAVVPGARGWQRAKSRVIGPAPPAQPTTSLAALTASVATHPSRRTKATEHRAGVTALLTPGPAAAAAAAAILKGLYMKPSQVTGTVQHVVRPTLPGEVCASSVVSPRLVVILLEADQGRQVQAEAQAGCLTTSRRSPPGSMLMRPVPAAALQHPHGIPGPAWAQISPNRSLRVLPDQLTGMPQEGADHKGGQSGREGVQQ